MGSLRSQASASIWPRLGVSAALVAWIGMAAAWPTLVQADPGDLDPNFSGNGKQTTDFGGDNESVTALAIQPKDGKIVAAGYSNAQGNTEFALARYQRDGDLDESFSNDGKRLTSFGGSADIAYGVAIQPNDGKIVAVGQTNKGGSGDFALARYNVDGSLDASFGSDGRVITSVRDGDSAHAVTVQEDGKIVAAGAAYAVGYAYFAVVRYNPDGSLDTGFGNGGKVITDFGGDGTAYAVAVQEDGKIVAAGGGGGNHFALARYNPDGSADTSFGTNGALTTDFGVYSTASGLVIQEDGKIVLAGGNWFDANDFLLARYNPNGSLDSGFGTGGKLTTDFGGAEQARGLAIQSDGKLVAAGFTDVGGTGKFALARYNQDGSLDPSFSDDGKKLTDFRGQDDAAYVVVIQENGKAVAGGYTYDDRDRDFALARYQAD